MGSETDESFPGAMDGSATASSSGGTPPYTYLWSTGQTADTATGLANGSYTCTITDANGCTTVVTVDISSTLVALEQELAGIHISVFPNPNRGSFFLEYEQPLAEPLQISVYNKLGQLVFVQEIPPSSQGKVELNPAYLAKGVYSVWVRGVDFHISEKVIVIE